MLVNKVHRPVYYVYQLKKPLKSVYIMSIYGYCCERYLVDVKFCEVFALRR